MPSLLFPIILVLIVLVAIVLIATSIRNVPEQTQLVVFRLGHFLGVRDAGRHFLVPVLDTGTSVDLRPHNEAIRDTEFILQARATLRLEIEYTWRVTDAAASIMNVANAPEGLRQHLRNTLQTLLALITPADVLMYPKQIEQELTSRVTERIQDWGIVLESVTLTNIH